MDLCRDFWCSPSPTPPVPLRNPHRSEHPNASPLPPLPVPVSPSEEKLIPPPLCVKRTRRMPPTVIPVTVLAIPSFPSTPSSSQETAPSSPTSLRSSSSTASSSSSPTSSPCSRSKLLYSSTPTCWVTVAPTWGPDTPKHLLRRKKSPKRETLRALRAKESDACLQRCYDEQTSKYLHGDFGGWRGGGLETLGEEN